MKSSDIIFIQGYNNDSNSYLIGDVLVDTGTGDNKQYLYSKIQEHGVNPEDISLIINTHCHYDHVGGNYLFENAKIAIHKTDAMALKSMDKNLTATNVFGREIKSTKVDICLEDGDEIAGFNVIHTPGHTSGGICLWDGVNLISGDTIFSNGGVGRWDLGGSFDELKNSVEKLTQLDVVNLLPGHGPVVEGNGKEHVKASYSNF